MWVSIVFHRLHKPHRQWLVVACAVRIHALRTGSFPNALQQLVPDILPELPVPFDGNPIAYAPTEGGVQIGINDDLIELTLDK